jgi:beta-1,4-mannosyltransferase
MRGETVTRRDGRRPRVLQSVRGPAPTTNPYVVQLVDACREHTEVRYFTWGRGIFGRYDVLHLHWPEVMLRRDGRAARLAARARFAAVMLRVTLLRTSVVRTLHNVRTHEAGSWWENLLLAWCERRTGTWIQLNPDTALPRPGRSRVIPHGHYRNWYPTPPGDVVPGRLLNFGLIRPYKGVEALLTAFAQYGDPLAGLHVVGGPTPPGLRTEVALGGAEDPRIRACLEYVDDARLSAEIGEAQLVVLPYREMHNSGALLLALSLDRPALVPDGPTTRALAAEAGPGWVLTFEDELTTADVECALEQTRRRPGGRPRLDGRDWSVVAGEHLAVYREAAAR